MTPLFLCQAYVRNPVPIAHGERVRLPMPGLSVVGTVTGITPGKLFVFTDDGRPMAFLRHHLTASEGR